MALLRLAYRLAYRFIQAWTFVRRPRVRGAMVLVTDAAGRVLLVRHTYGDRRRWELPGGWLRDGEHPLAGARREVREELGLDLPLRPLVAVEGDWDHKHEALAAFRAEWPGGRAHYDPVEIAEVAWFDPAQPPAHAGAGTRAVLGALERSAR